MAEIGMHVLSDEPIEIDFSQQKAFVGNPELTISDIDVLAAHNEAGEDVSAQVFDGGRENQIEAKLVRVWITTPPAGRIKITCRARCLPTGEGVVWQDPDRELPYLVVNGDGAQVE